MASTRGTGATLAGNPERILALLRGGSHTVQELADQVGVTPNAVRLHLARLEREGWVGPADRRPSGGKPAQAWAVTPEAEVRLSQAYAPALTELVATLAEQLDHAELVKLLRAAGERLAGPARGDGETRRAAALAALQRLGGQATLEPVAGGVVIRGDGCPLAASVRRTPETCRLVEALLAVVLGQPVRMECLHAERPSCRFRIPDMSKGSRKGRR